MFKGETFKGDEESRRDNWIRTSIFKRKGNSFFPKACPKVRLAVLWVWGQGRVDFRSGVGPWDWGEERSLALQPFSLSVCI